MSINHSIYLLILLILGITACAIDPVKLPDAMNMMADSIDPPDSQVSEQAGKQMFIATMTDAAHRELTGGRPINQMDMDIPDNTPAGYKRFINAVQRQYGIKRVADWPLKSIGVRCLVFEILGQQNRDRVIRDFQQHARIEMVQPLQHFKTFAKDYNDPYLKLQHTDKSMAFTSSHRWATGKGVNVAIIDTGVDVSHEDLKGQFRGSENFVDANQSAFQTDLHGTAIAGVIAARTGNGKGMTGIAPDARLWAMKACWSQHVGALPADCSTFTLAKAINFAVENQVDIINLSLAGPKDPLLERLLHRGLKDGIIVVASISSNPKHDFPASIQNVIAVEQSEGNENENNHVKMLGDNILSTRPGNQYDYYSGSSFSTAQITGLVTLIKERKPHISGNKIKALLTANKTQYRSVSSSVSEGVNACQLMARLVGTECLIVEK